MYRLETLGGLSLTADIEPLRATQRRRLALLALLAVAGERGLSRDKLQAYLWPESPPENARHALEQLLYALRRQLGEDAFLGSNPVALNRAVIGSDVDDFQRALEQGALEEAAALYRGPFLDGFFLNGAAEFEKWVESERSRLAARYSRGLEELARRSAGQGDHSRAVESWRQLVAIDPLSSRATLGLMRAVAAAGDRPAALRQAQIYERLVREALQSDPDPAIHAFVEELPVAPPAPVRISERSAEPLSIPDRSTEQPADKIELEVTTGTWPKPRPSQTSGRLPGIAVAMPAVLGVGLLLALLLRHQAPARSTADRLAANRIVIVPFGVATSDSSLTYLRDGMVDLLAAKLTGEVGPVAVDPRTTLSAWRRAKASEGADNWAAAVRLAHMVGAGQILQGEVVQVGGNFLLNGTVRNAEDQQVHASTTVSGPADSLLGLVDSLAAKLLALQAGEGFSRLALLTSRSLPALHAYLDGRAAYRRGESSLAMTDYIRALELDSTFALAGLELVVSSGWVFTWTVGGFPYRIPLGPGGLLGQPGRYQLQWIQAMDLAWSNRHRLGPRDLATLTALRGPRYPEGRRARELLDTWWQLAQSVPDRADAWYLVGHILLYQGAAMGIADAHEQASAAFHRALALDPDFAPPLAGLLELAAQRGDTADVRRLGHEYLAHDSSGPSADYVRWHVAALTGDEAWLQAIRARFDAIDVETLDRIQWTAQMEGIDLEDAGRALTALVRRFPNDSGYALFYATMWALNRGRPREALRIMEEKRKVEGNRRYYDLYRVLYGVYWDLDPTAAGESARFVEAHAGSLRVDPTAHWRLAQWWLAHGDTARAVEVLEMLRSDSFAWSQTDKPGQIPLLASLLLASIRRQPNLPSLLASADSFTADGCCNIPGFANLLVAHAHERAGDLRGALAAVRRQHWYYPPEYLSAALREEGRLAALTGDTAGAIRAYRHYLALRFDPEPELRPEAERIRQELARLERR